LLIGEDLHGKQAVSHAYSIVLKALLFRASFSRSSLMKVISLIFWVILGFAPLLYAVKDLGNGGHVWICYKPGTHEIEKIESIDLVEAIGKGKLMTPTPLKVVDFSAPGEKSWSILNDFNNQLKQQSPLFLYDVIHRHVEKILKIIHFTSMGLPFSNDLNYVENGVARHWPEINPDCSGNFEIRQAAIYYPDKDVLMVDANLWGSRKFSEFNKFVLLLHEAMYSFARARFPHPPDQMSSHTAGLWVAQLLYNQSIQAKENFFDDPKNMP
jgi:hypothetical protein